MHKNRRANIILIAVNILLVIAMAASILYYITLNRQQNLERSMESVLNATESMSSSIKLYFTQQYNSLLDKKKYVEHREMDTPDTIIDFLKNSNTSDKAMYQLLYINDGEYNTGVSVSSNGITTDIQYKHSSYEGTVTTAVEEVGKNDFDDSVISLTGSFINIVNAKKSVAFYTGVKSAESGVYTLMCVVALDDLFESGLPVINYDEASGAIIGSDSEYIAKTGAFRSSSLFEHLISAFSCGYDYTAELQKDMVREKSGTLTLTNNLGKSFLFSYNYINDSDDWFYVSKVPVSVLEQTNVDMIFTLLIGSFLLVLIFVDGLYISRLNINLKKSLESVKSAMEIAERANLAKSSFLSRITHEIRTPLNAVIGYMTIAQTYDGDIDKINECVNKTEIAAKHLLSIINDVLDVSAIESGKIKLSYDNFNFKNFITAITVMFYTLAQSGGVDFEIIFENTVDEIVIGDQMRINQILINLLNNAIKFTKKGGKVQLIIKQEDVNENQIKMSFTVKDTGIGMTPEFLARIWEPFEQADSTISRKYGGTGLGLSISKNLTSMMNGTISVKSELNKGSCFCVELPLGKTEQRHLEQNYDFSSIRALVVDDERDTCEYVKLLMNRYNIRCSECYSGEEAVRKFGAAQAGNDRFTLCLVDMKMPGMDGLETAAEINRICGGYDTPVVIISAYDFNEFADKAKKIGVKRFVAKPLFQSTLFDLLMDLVSEKTPANEQSEKHSHTEKELDGIHILLAEDNRMNMEIAVMLLNMAGAKVDGVWNGKQACEKFITSDEGTYDIILMDIQMPEMDGYTATSEIRSSAHPQSASIPIVAMTANVFDEDIETSLKSGMNEHISKPIDRDLLIKVVLRLAGKK